MLTWLIQMLPDRVYWWLASLYPEGYHLYLCQCCGQEDDAA